MKIARAVFYVEALGNFIAACMLFFTPGTFVSQFVNQSVPPLPLELFRWYGVLLYVFVYVMLRALAQPNENTLVVIVEGFLLGDLIQLVGCYLLVSAGGTWTLALVGFTAATIILAGVRAYWLWGHYRRKRISDANVK